MTNIETITSFAKRKGFIYQSSEIYGGFQAIYDYGPYGVELAKNIKDLWWKHVVQKRADIVGLDSAIFMHPKIWEASGHVANFTDPLIECKSCNRRIRADKMLEECGIAVEVNPTLDAVNQLIITNASKVRCPICGGNKFTEARSFNLLVTSNLGSALGDGDVCYLRGETCQGIFVNFKNVTDSTRVKIPFGIAQIGKAFRNEITARQFVFRTREFEQMELQYFIEPGNDSAVFSEMKQWRWNWYKNVIGIDETLMRFRQHDNLAFYASDAFDIEFQFPWGFDEIEGVHARTDYDLTQHEKFSGKKLKYRTEQGEFTPHVIETSAGVGRIMLATLFNSYFDDKENERVVLKINPKLAPVKIAVFPLKKNDDLLVNKAKEVFELLLDKWQCEFDDNGNVGKRYRRQDEIGTPYCITIDFETLDNSSVTVRQRDSMEQERVPIENLITYFSELL